MGIKLMPCMATLTNKNQMDSNKRVLKICVAIDNQYYWCAVFGGTAEYLDSFANVGAQLFLEEWTVTKNENYYDFIIGRTKIVKNAEAKNDK